MLSYAKLTENWYSQPRQRTISDSIGLAYLDRPYI